MVAAGAGVVRVLTDAASRAVLVLLHQQPDWDISAASSTAEMSGIARPGYPGVTAFKVLP